MTHEELVRYANLENNNGLNKEWADALIKALEEHLPVDRYRPYSIPPTHHPLRRAYDPKP